MVARLLHERGWTVEVFLYVYAEKLPPDARENYERWCALGEVGDLGKSLRTGLSSEHCNLVIDAVFGTGLSRAMESPLSAIDSELDLYEPVWRGGPYKVAIDIPSGMCADSGKILGDASNVFFADLTVAFQFEKIGHRMEAAIESVSKVRTVDIGLAPLDQLGSLSRKAIERSSGEKRLGRVLCWLQDSLGTNYFEKGFNENKFSHGHVLVVAGGRGNTGAARLSARGALRVGAGLVTLGVPADAGQEVASQITAIMMKTVDDAEDLSVALEDTGLNALCLGPALGLDRAKTLVAAALEVGLDPRPTVLDADALSAFADDPNALFSMLHEKCVLTPHGGEFARLFPDISGKLNEVPTKGPAYSKVDAAREAAKRAGCVVLFKGADTVIAAPDGSCSINSAHYERSAPWLATAGSGDVLAGFITGLLVRGFDPMAAAETAAWLHVECALKFGPGLIAEDIPEQLPAVFRDLGL